MHFRACFRLTIMKRYKRNEIGWRCLKLVEVSGLLFYCGVLLISPSERIKGSISELGIFMLGLIFEGAVVAILFSLQVKIIVVVELLWSAWSNPITKCSILVIEQYFQEAP